MFYWIITLVFVFVGTPVAWKILTYLWNKYDRLTITVLPQLRAGTNMPGEYNYWDLKFSLARHAVMFIITAAVIFWVESRIILNIFFYGYGLYTASVIVRHSNRKDILKKLSNSEEERALADMLKKPFKDSRVILVYSVCASIVAIILYAIRP